MAAARRPQKVRAFVGKLDLIEVPMPRLLLLLAVFAVFAACRPWARGPRVSPVATGLIGDWIGPMRPASRDTTVWHFTADGRSVQVRIRPSHRTQEVPFGPFQVYADSEGRQLICFSYRRGRARPACRYFQIDKLTDASGRESRQLRLLNWVGEKHSVGEIWTERSP